ncbi:MAG: DEAD/DEAH box helicase [Deltaproteobacteria bacterium]|jgi:ATP-dependent RNA helicase DeaD|nr:DEAD/DEAH box helicase [Deltaproteobacteria bacterium]MBT4269174.1 DEAD/DEAH box helicase [Deltaproteobacteria bacterium]MBT4639432.1 DEAD/DEAH box helicase [Deltaproteobacteria bacterium]MBT6500384.1 DEAD/DEAH box helicase [Deltaproteobacteria bacterium]MBT6614043.1 DEAD/DEAH box helicase [Deltaproteobacteria bacterium]
MKFSDLGTLPELEKALGVEGITEPTPVQIQSAEVLYEGRDVFISSETGTGKTLAYLLPLLCRIDLSVVGLQAMIITPTHELALQVQHQIQRLLQHSGMAIRSQVLIGETPIKRQTEKLKKKPQVVIGSTGRLLDLIKMKKLKVHTVKSIVMDEIDRLLVGELLVSIRAIIKSTLKERQLIFVSATEHKTYLREAETLAQDLVKVNAKSKRINPDIEHLYVVAEERKKIDLMRRLIHAMLPERAIVFVHRNEKVEVLKSKLAYHKIKASQIHKECTKLERKKALDDFRKGRSTVLISSDISSRGLDIKGVSHIFNLDLPAQSDAYIHRAGRTGRAGSSGTAVSLVTQQEVRTVQKHASYLKIQIKERFLKEGKVLDPDDAN